MPAEIRPRKARSVSYTEEMDGRQAPDEQRSLRAEQVAQTRAALVLAGRSLFGRSGYAAASVEDLAREAGVTTGALYHHFPTKAALFEAVFELVHGELMAASGQAAEGASDVMDALAAAFEAFLDKVLEPDVQRILITERRRFSGRPGSPNSTSGTRSRRSSRRWRRPQRRAACGRTTRRPWRGCCSAC